MSFSPVVAQLIQALLDPSSDVRRIGKILAVDPVLSASILRMANTPYYGAPAPVTSLEKAALLLGTRELLKLALNISFKNGLHNQIKLPREHLYQAWRAIVWGAIIGEKLNEQCRAAPKETAYLTILLKDISLFLLYDESNGVPWICPSRHNRENAQTELEHWGESHAQISSQLALSWKLPEPIATAIADHHKDPAELGTEISLSLIAALATRWSELMHSPEPEVEKLIRLEMLVATVFGLNEAQVQKIREESTEEFRSILQGLDVPEAPRDERLYELPVEVIKSLYFLSQELVVTGNDLMDMAIIIGKHLDFFWQTPDWKLCLQIPKHNRYMLFYRNPEGMGLVQEGPTAFLDEPAAPGGGVFPLHSDRSRLGSLLLPPGFPSKENAANFRSYIRLMGQALGAYYEHQAAIKSQAGLLRDLPVGVARLSSEGFILEANNMLRRNLGLTPDAGNLNLLDILEERGKIPLRETWQKVCGAEDRPHASFILNLHKQASPANPAETDQVWVLSLHYWREMGEDEILLILVDLTELSELETQALQQRDFLENLFGVMQELVLTIDGSGRITWVAPPNRSLRGKNFFDICRPSPITHIWGPDLLANKEALRNPVEVGIKISEQRLGLFEFVFAPLRGDNSYLLVGRDLTNIRRLAAQIKRQAFNDGLTGLFNHGHFRTLLAAQTELQRKKGVSLGLMFMDLDKFKDVNDEEGHSAGDNILKIVARILLSQVRQGNDFACRYGGDEFAVIVPGVSGQGLEAMAGRIVAEVAKGCGGKVSASIGLALLKPEESPADFLNRADRAVYEVKRRQGNGFAWG